MKEKEIDPYTRLVLFIDRHHISAKEEMDVLRPIINAIKKQDEESAFNAAREIDSSDEGTCSYRYQNVRDWRNKNNLND